MSDTFYNTTSESGQTLMEFKETTKDQDSLVLHAFRSSGMLTPFEALAILLRGGNKIILNSVRRSINTLTRAGKLEKTGIKKAGDYGRSNYVWRIKT